MPKIEIKLVSTYCITYTLQQFSANQLKIAKPFNTFEVDATPFAHVARYSLEPVKFHQVYHSFFIDLFVDVEIMPNEESKAQFPPFNTYEIPKQMIKYEEFNVLGSGSYGTVVQAKYNNKDVAVKQIPMTKLQSEMAITRLLEEVNSYV